VARAILDSPDRAESKLAHATVAPRVIGYEQAVTSQTLVRARSARGIFLRKSLSKVADDFDPYLTNIPYIRGIPVAPVPRLYGKIVWSEVQYLC
jgi:hypothetical protein